jgi:multimeric flavodoxin WrbA
VTPLTFVLGVLGSPRPAGNTDLLLDAALEGAKEAGAEVRKVVLAALDIHPCTGCEGCADGGGCVIADDMVPLYPLIDEADVILIASPVYFDGVSAQTKAFIDRGQLFWVRKYVLKRAGKKKRGAFLSAGARLRTDFVCPEATVRAYLFTVNAELVRTLAYAGFEERGAIVDHPTALCDARALGRELVAGAVGRNVH